MIREETQYDDAKGMKEQSGDKTVDHFREIYM